MVCVQCGAIIEGKGKNAQLCDKCAKENKRKQDKANIAWGKTYRPETKHREEARMSISEYNRFQRERGLTYGGKPLGSAFPREPKFMEGVKTRWRKSDSESQ